LAAEEKLRIIQEFYNKKKQIEQEGQTETKKIRDEDLEDVDEFFRDFQQAAQLSVQVFSQYLQTQLMLLEEEEKRVLEQVVGDSEEAEKKRTEIQEEYENRRKELSKKNQLAQLELSRIQAVANIAEAITKALAETLNPVFAGILSVLGLAQVGVITQQIAAVRNLARGGLLVGPSHEYGGVPLAGGGVVAEGGEAVINRRASIDYRGLLNEVSLSSGGAPMVSSSFDDTRLIEAITKQNRTPIKAYVLEKEISKSQGINKRLQQLSKI